MRTWLMILLLFSASSIAGRPITALAGEQHSFLQLGEDFFVRCVMKPIKGAKLLLFSKEAATEAGFSVEEENTPNSEIERSILKQFAFFIERCEPRDKSQKIANNGERVMFATRYHDSQDIGEQTTQGDGRAVWSGEIRDRNRYYDVVVKGVGRTTLAKNLPPNASKDEIAHNDGLQSYEEGVHSFIVSEINRRNHIVAPRDIAVILLPIEKQEGPKHGSQKSYATLTIRIGQQTRMGHLEYFIAYPQPKLFKTLFNYVVMRALGEKALDTPSKTQIRKYLETFAKNTGTQAAQLYDLLAQHGSLTRGNMTTLGQVIDFGTFTYLPTYPTWDMAEEAGVQGFAQQTSQIFDYLSELEKYIQDSRYYEDKNDKKSAFKNLSKIQIESFNSVLTRLMLSRLGLDPKNIDRAVADAQLKSVLEKLVANGRKLLEYQSIFDGCNKNGMNIRFVFANTFNLVSQINDFQSLKELYEDESSLCDRLKGTDESDLVRQLQMEYTRFLSKPQAEGMGAHLFSLFQNLNQVAVRIGALRNKTPQSLLEKWGARAAALHANTRPSQKTRDLIIEVMKTTSTPTMVQPYSEAIINSLVDSGLYNVNK